MCAWTIHYAASVYCHTLLALSFPLKTTCTPEQCTHIFADVNISWTAFPSPSALLGRAACHAWFRSLLGWTAQRCHTDQDSKGCEKYPTSATKHCTEKLLWWSITEEYCHRCDCIVGMWEMHLDINGRQFSGRHTFQKKPNYHNGCKVNYKGY